MPKRLLNGSTYHRLLLRRVVQWGNPERPFKACAFFIKSDERRIADRKRLDIFFFRGTKLHKTSGKAGNAGCMKLRLQCMAYSNSFFILAMIKHKARWITHEGINDPCLIFPLRHGFNKPRSFSDIVVRNRHEQCFWFFVAGRFEIRLIKRFTNGLRIFLIIR